MAFLCYFRIYFVEGKVMNSGIKRGVKKGITLLMAMLLTVNVGGATVLAEDTGNMESFSEEPTGQLPEEPTKESDTVLDTNAVSETGEAIGGNNIQQKQAITGFGNLERTSIEMKEKLPVEELGLPKQIPVYIDNAEEVVNIDVNWVCEDDYENTNFEIYTFNPVWDEDSFELGAEVDSNSIPYIEVSVCMMDNANKREATTVTPEATDYTISAGTITGLSTTYLASLSDEQKQNINLVIPERVNGVPVTAIGSHAFDCSYNYKIYGGCRFVGLDLSAATGLTTIKDYAFAFNSSITGTLQIPDSVIDIYKYAFNGCNFTGQLNLPTNLKSIGDSAFKISTAISFTGKLVIPASVTTIEKVAFSGQEGITSVQFDGNQITELPDSVFRYCHGISGVIKLPSSIQKIGNNTFGETNMTTIYLPKRADTGNMSLVTAKTFASSSVKAIVCDKADYNDVCTMLGNSFKSYAGYEMTVSFNTNGGDTFDPITRLYNHAYNIVKQDDGQWLTTDYKFPQVANKEWALSASTVASVSETDKITQENLYLIDALEPPVYSFSEDINKVYDEQPVKLTVTAEHPLAQNGSVRFYYRWRWDSITPPTTELEGYGENEYSFSDVRADFEIGCTVTIQACVIHGTTPTVFDTKKHTFKVHMQQADPIVTPIYPKGMLNIANGLPEIKLLEGDTSGTIEWDANQTFEEGIHEYNWTFTPEKNKVGGYNYKTAKGSVQLNGVNGDVYNITPKATQHGSITPNQPFEAVQSDDIKLSFTPDMGYKLSSVMIDGTTDVMKDVTNNEYTLKNIQSDHTVSATFEQMTPTDVEDTISNLPDISNKEDVTEEERNSILDAKLHYDAISDENTDDISEDSKKQMYEAISQLPQVETNVIGNLNLPDPLPLLENMGKSDAEALKKDSNTALKIDLIVEDANPNKTEQDALIGALGNGVIGKSYNISVIKKLVQGNNVIAENPLNQLKSPVQLVFDIPKELQNVDPGYKRTLFIVRVHTEDDKTTAEILEDEDENESTITISSDKFSNYTLAYKDTKEQSEEKTYTVDFETSGGSTIQSITNIKAGEIIQKPADPEKAGYQFKGWYTDKECTKLWNFDTETVQGNTTLYAGWEKIDNETKTYTVHFDSLGGSKVESVSGLSKGDKLTAPASPKKEGCRFTGWYTDKECTKLWDFEKDTVNETMTLYAGWEKVKTAAKINTPGTPNKKATLKTGDSSHILVYVLAASLSILIIFGVLIISRKHNKRNKKK